MLIGKSNLAMTSAHESKTSDSSRAVLQANDSPEAAAAFARMLKEQLQAVPADLLKIDTDTSTRTAAGAAGNSPFTAILEMLFGLQQAPNASARPDPGPGAPQGLPWHGLQLVQLTQTRETESCSFAASGSICLADGSTRQFGVSYSMERSEESSSLSLGTLRDPLVVDLDAPGTALGKTSVAFDLDADGTAENVRLPAGNSAVLFRDRNHNDKADDGSELFGPTTGSGFGELAQLDGDGNGWIDGGDAAYADLKLWQVADDGTSSVRSLADAGIGALATASADTPFTLKEDGAIVGQVRASSVWLGEKSGAGVVRQIDVATTPRENASA